MGASDSKIAKSLSIKRPRFLCLHGWRTSGDVLKGQMKAFCEGVDIECVYMNAPFKGIM
jgi:hypothetical protein